jgi:hypothetical protein
MVGLGRWLEFAGTRRGEIVLMTTAWMLLLLAFQAPATSPAKPLIENARVRVWENAASIPSDMDTVTVTMAGAVRYSKAGARGKGAKLVIGLKSAPVTALTNRSGYPLALPRPGARRVLDNDRVAVWDYAWTPRQRTPMHFHDKDVVVMFLQDGDLQSTTPSGVATVNSYKPGAIRFNARDRVHTEELVRGSQRAIIVELK